MVQGPGRGARRLAVAVVSLSSVLGPVAAAAAEGPEPSSAVEATAGEDHDIGLGNLGSGWAEPWRHRHRYTPDMALLRVTTNFLERELRTDWAETKTRGNASLDRTDFGNALIAYGISRRLMLEVFTSYQWNTGLRSTEGGTGGAILRAQLVESETSSWALQARAAAPNRGLGQTQTSLSGALAGWQDMHDWVPALGRLGLYWSAQIEQLFGEHKTGVRTHTATLAGALAETLTQPTTPVLGNFTVFVEALGTTDLDGDKRGDWSVSLTPGLRFWFLPENSLIAGLELPLGNTPSFSRVARVTYILNF